MPSVHACFQPMMQGGPFEVDLQTQPALANEALQVTREVLTGFLVEGPSETELQAVRQRVIGNSPLSLDSSRKILEAVAVLWFYGLPIDCLDRYADNADEVTVDEIKATFFRHVELDDMVTVVVGSE